MVDVNEVKDSCESRVKQDAMMFVLYVQVLTSIKFLEILQERFKI